ncbi:hypothetical protein RDI58_022415 [Solanum bulbocastanum]|uniref:Uncharacterized protein n=1 Tax=Solanum bulbocastanum TaxID=147425 RepID=A0AAN8TAN0_SOLBU
MVHQLISEIDVDDDYDMTRFIYLQSQNTYYQNLVKKKLFLNRGISLGKVPETFPRFYQRLVATRWLCFAVELYKANEQWMRELYAILMLKSIQVTIGLAQGTIFIVKKGGEGTPTNIKKRKMESWKVLCIEVGSTRPSTARLFETLAEELRVVQELVTKLPQGLGETFVGHNSSIPQ